MAIRNETIGLMDDAINAIGKEYNEISICELGNQRTKDELNYKTGKEYLEAAGSKHLSIDLNGLDGAIALDLSKPVDKYHGHFDMVTNYGTTEHVGNQYEVFKNIHNFTKKGGAMVHASPLAPYWYYHGNCNYEFEFYKNLAEANDYKVIISNMVRHSNQDVELYILCYVLIKENNNPFVSPVDFKNIRGIVENDDERKKQWREEMKQKKLNKNK